MKPQLILLPIFALFTLSATPLAAQTFTDIAVSTSSICGLLDSGKVDCSTRNNEVSSERYAPPSDLPPMIQISSGEQHSCGIDLEGKAVCWGGGVTQSLKDEYPFGYFDQLKIPEIDQPLISIATGTHHSCAIDINNKAWCWGLNSNGQTQPPGDGLGSDGMGYVKIDAEENFSCGIQTNGNIECWSTDERITRSNIVEGPFVDLDVHSANACGLKDDGSIECWWGQISTPANGPYTDLVVSRGGVCGLNLNQTLDCESGESYFSNKLPVFADDLSFTQIESSASVYSLDLPFCGITISGDIKCSEDFSGFSVPGIQNILTTDLSNVRLPISARRYSKNQIELSWAEQRQGYGLNALRFEIYRNDQLVDTTSNLRSWYDDSQQTINPVSYRIRAIDGRGNLGPFSPTIIVDNENGSVTQGDGAATNFDFVTPIHTVDSVKIAFLGNKPLITWSGSTPGINGLKGYEVRVDNKVVSFSDGFSVPFAEYSSFNCFQVSVAAISFDDKIFDYRTTVVNRSAGNYSCDSF